MHVTLSIQMPRRRGGMLLVAGLVMVLFPGCSLLQKLRGRGSASKDAPTQRTRQVQLIGKVALVNVEESFVLIDNGQNPGPGMGATVQCRMPDGTSAELKVTEIRKRPYVIADVVSGTPQKGAPVFW